MGGWALPVPAPSPMPPEESAGFAPAWRAGLLRLGLAWAGLILAFWPEWRAMADQWWNSASYTHILVVPAILGWLVAMRAAPLLRIEPRCWWPGLVVLALAVKLWALGAFMGVALASEAGAVAMLAACVPLLLGPRVTAGLVFPLCYMAFLVPLGDELIPPLQELTARMTVALLHLTGVGAALDGVFIRTKVGMFEIAQACSGVKFLIAMLAFGALAANVCFVRWWRRAVFMLACVVLPVLANGVRAWGTVYVAQFKGVAWAGSFDHIVYGWIFFAIVIALTLAGSWRWFDRAADAPMIDGARIAASPRLAAWERYGVHPLVALLLGGALVGVGLGWVSAANGLHAKAPAEITLPPVPGWSRLGDEPNPPWQPRASGAVRRVMGSYQDKAGRRVEVFVALYDGQGPGRKPAANGEGAVPLGSAWQWQGAGAPLADARAERMLGLGGVSRLAETSYRGDGLLTGSRIDLALAGARDRLLLRPAPVVVVIFSASGQGAAEAIGAFRASLGPLDRWLDGIATDLYVADTNKHYE